ncbi:MAG: hypothetical protein KH415_21910 [Clostridium sp.]|nr:hypothetical protein [Clostridium sp.]
MYLLYVFKIYALALLKISYEALIAALIIFSIMATIRYLTKDKCYFTKKINKIRRYMHGINFRHCR